MFKNSYVLAIVSLLMMPRVFVPAMMLVSLIDPELLEHFELRAQLSASQPHEAALNLGSVFGGHRFMVS